MAALLGRVSPLTESCTNAPLDLDFRTMDLERDGQRAVEMRTDGYLVSFGHAREFLGEDGLGAERYIASIGERQSEFPQGFVHVWNGQEPVGQVEARPREEDPTLGYVGFFYVLPRWRRNAVGAAEERYALDVLRAAGCTRVELSVSPTNNPAWCFYERLGWADLGLRVGRTDVHRLQKFL